MTTPPTAADAASLNPQQQAAVFAPDGPVLVLAGPGSGKTRVLTERVAHVVEGGVPAWRVMAVTFTNKAAREMRARLERRLGEEAAAELNVGTFHALCARILRRDAEAVGIRQNFVIYDTSDQVRVVKRVLDELQMDPKQHEPKSILAEISNAKNQLIGPEAYVAESYNQEIVRRVYGRYHALLRQANAVDFDDLLMYVALLLRTNQEARDRLRRRITRVLVDEFQDTNGAQYEIVTQLVAAEVKDAPHSLFAVGDEDQSIYSWRGADYRNVLRFREDFPNAVVVLLERNYRSTQNILDAARAVIDRNEDRTEKKLWTSTGAGRRLTRFEAYNEAEEAGYVLQELRKLQREGVPLGEIAVMYRTNAQSRAVEDALVRYRIPYTLVGATRFYERKEVRDVLAYLRLVHNPDDDVSLERIINVPPRGIGPKALELLRAWSGGASLYTGLERIHQGFSHAGPALDGRTQKALLAFRDLVAELVVARDLLPVPELVTLVLQRSGYVDWLRDGSPDGEERWENVGELRGVAEDFSALEPPQGLATMLESVALVADVDAITGARDRVTLLTLHSAKGLEFNVVFLLGLEEGLLPHSRSQDDAGALEEERRLFYVGITRARERVVVSHAFRRMVFGSGGEAREPSRFLLDLPDQIVDVVGATAEGKSGPRTRQVTRWESAAPAATGPAAETGFRPGDKVRHGTFGIGTVVTAAPKDGDEEVTVAFQGAGIKKLLQSFARLERVA